ncbi:hypothetical protein [uncultured Salinibacterium sp.]|uniref:hypothetical protein n=1 Tax=uncultured Salinibacterium sp. TaxID=459274 RepID=UPI0030D97753
MTNTTTSTQGKEADAVGLLWVISKDELHAPPWLGEQSLREQEELLRRQAEQDGVLLEAVFTREVSFDPEPQRLLFELLDCTKRWPTARIYLLRESFIREPSTLMLYSDVLKALGVELVICD